MSFLSRLYTWSKEQALVDIIKTYSEKWRVVVSFLYFANVMKGRLLEAQEESRQKEYKMALEQSDFLLPDGIALQLFYRRWSVGRMSGNSLYNLNGTDFIPYFLRSLVQQGKRLHIGLYDLYDEHIGKPKELIETAKERFHEQIGVPVSYVFQAHFSQRFALPFDEEEYAKSLASNSYDMHILLLCIGTPAQELRSYTHQEFLRSHRVLAINAGGTIDYISGFEQRAPKRVVKARVLETFRRVSRNPKKNLKKFLVMFGVFRYRWYILKRKVKIG